MKYITLLGTMIQWRSLSIPVIFACALSLTKNDGLCACTTFSISQPVATILGSNYDWETGAGLVVLNRRNVIRGGELTLPIDGMPSQKSQRWRSLYGSITFNQYGVGHPIGGMNERGLVVELLWTKAARYPPGSSKPALGVFDWVQYQLDRYASVDEVLESVGDIAISSTIPAHYFLADSTGASAAIEFIDGRIAVSSGDGQPVKILTDSPYRASLEYLQKCVGFGGSVRLATTNSLDRFARAALLVQDAPTDGGRTNLIDYGFHILDQVSQGNDTRWSIVFDLRRRRMFFRTRLQRAVKYIDLRPVDFTCERQTMIASIDQRSPGSATRRFKPLTFETNRDLIFTTFRATSFLKDLPDNVLNDIALKALTSICWNGSSDAVSN